MKHFILSLQFLSRLYLPWMIEGEDDMFARSLKFFPLAGCIIGLLDAGGLWLLLRVFTPLTAGILVVLFDIALTGGLHMDGLADTIDGLSSHRGKERMLEIMKDSRIGTFGVIAIVGEVIVKAALIMELFTHENGWIAYGVIAAVPILSRMTMVLMIYVSKYAREEGIGGLFFSHKSSICLPAALISGILLSLVSWYYAPVLLISGLLCAFLTRAICYHKIGGMTGDTLGATLELEEAVMLMAAVLFAAFI